MAMMMSLGDAHPSQLAQEETVIDSIRWFERKWDFSLPVGAFPSVLERLRGTPVRAGALVAGINDGVLGARNGGTWSAKEHLAHLDDLHELDERRFDDFLARSGALAVADLANQRTQTANHNASDIGDILKRLSDHRLGLVARMESATAEDIVTICVHPRLKQPMRLIDWAFFVAEHDDHHLVAARLAIRAASAPHT
jgi:hypothetical protein